MIYMSFGLYGLTARCVVGAQTFHIGLLCIGYETYRY